IPALYWFADDGARLLHHTPPSDRRPTSRELLSSFVRVEPQLDARWLDDKTLMLSGRCHDLDKLSALIEKLRADGVRLQQEMVCDEDLKRSVRALLANYGYNDVLLMLSADGLVSIDGPVRNDALFPELVDALDKIPGLRDWQISNRTADELGQLLSKLRIANLLTGVSAVRSERGWMLSGQFEPERLEALTSLVASWNIQVGSPTPMRFVSATAAAVRSTDYFPAAISIVGGNANSPFLELANGMRLTVGSSALSGTRIVDISAAGVSLIDGQRLIFLPLRH
ncbi:type III secretion system inner membrane ring subunit SctD, partial [Paraburkholderia sp. RL17-373-BIF-A]|uniref:type III secretion system inner membrane ring subunit SctD n=1 Tax=Paraburkholderia sp. RL17-373-BIF-A TaxID=3031629 RepID=UPI0038B84CB4